MPNGSVVSAKMKSVRMMGLEKEDVDGEKGKKAAKLLKTMVQNYGSSAAG